MAEPTRATALLPLALAILVLAIAGAASSPAPAAGAGATRQKTIDSTVRFLQESQRPSGGFANPGRPASQSITSWVALALAGAGINPQDQATCGVDAFTYLETHFAAGFREEAAWPQTATTAFERELLTVDGAGTDPHDFAGYDLVREILDRQLPDGSFPYVPGGRGEVNDTAFAVLALAPVADPAVRAAVDRAAGWLATQQNEGGAWSWQVKGTTDNVDLTGGVVEALNAAGRPGTDAQAAAFDFLRRVQRPDGGFSEVGPGESNVASTAWAVQGLWAGGEDPEAWLTGSGAPTEEPLDYMESLQQPDGHVRWKQSSDMNGIWMTAYVMPAFAGQALPMPRVPRSLPSAAAPAGAALPTSCAEPAPGGGKHPQPGAGSTGAGEGVIVAGGGNGAPDFSRPQPQSKGKTPGGARNLHRDRHPENHSPTRRGENKKQPRGAERSEPNASTAEAALPAVVGAGSGGGDGPASTEGARGTPIAAAAPERGGSSKRSDGREVSGTLIGSPNATRKGKNAFGAPGLRSGASGADEGPWTALAIAAGALLLALAGAQVERHRRVALP